ncbi:MAG TPA: DNA primase [Flavobacteriaceae bacterium]|nr:DNA primase [Flavobacteriaceae bacterium]
MINRTTIDQVFEAARVEEVIGEFVHLKKAGANFKGLSPFVDEKSPSFMVSPVKQIWKDFSTGKGGNVISFLMEHSHYTYPEAIRYLAKKYNIEIEETEQTDEQKQQQSARESMYLVSEYARDYFHKILLENPKGKAIGYSYFKERGFTDEIIKKYELGYALDDWTAFTDEALKNKYSIEFLEKTGLTIVKETKKFDRFKGRVLFPIHSMSGRVLGFGGRILKTDKKAAKYLNSPESEIYHKSKILYGIYHAKQTIAKEDNCYLVEGYTDVISFDQSGIHNTVASSGTALTADQIRLVSRLTNNITVLFDGDAAGMRASIRGIDLILEQGMNVKVVAFPDGEDPDSFAKSVSTEELKAYLKDNSQDFIQFKVSLLLKDAANDPVKKAGLIREIVQSIAKIPSAIQREVYVQECANIMQISEKVLFGELAQIRNKNEREDERFSKNKPLKVVKTEKPKAIKVNQLNILEKHLIEILLLYGNKETEFTDFVEEENDEGDFKIVKHKFTNTVSKEIYLHLQDDEIEFTNSTFKSIYYDIIHQLNQDERISIEKFINHEDPNIGMTVSDLLMDDERYTLSDWVGKNIYVKTKEKALAKLVMDAVYNIRRILIEQKITEIKSQIISSENKREDLDLVKNYTSLKKLIYNKLARVV